MQFGHDDSPMAESLRQKNRSGGGGASFVPFEYNYFPYATQLISSGVFKRYALDRIAPTIAAGAYTKVGTGIAISLSSRQENLWRAFLRTKLSEQRRFKNGS